MALAPLHRASFALFLLAASACGGAQNATPPAEPPHVATNAAPATPSTSAPPAPSADAPPKLSPPIDEKAVATATGVEKPEKAPDGTIKASFPRTDVPVDVDGWKMPPFMGLTSWAAFAPAKSGVADAMVMGDLVVFEDEVNPVMSVLLDNGLSVTALHNHFFADNPHVYFMHIGGEGTVAQMGKTVRMAIDKTTEIRKKTPKPKATFAATPLPAKSTIDGAKVESALGYKGQAKDGMWKAVVGRTTNAACGCPIGKAMGVNTWAAFAGTDDNAVVDGDFAVAEHELQAVLKALRAGGINIVAIHHHMSGETPRILFLHYWGRGKATDLATTVRKAIDLTESDKPTG